MLRFANPLLKAIFVIALLNCLYAGAASASTVLEMSFAQVVEHSELVFEGRVQSVEPQILGDGRIYTFVEFEILDVVKGAYTDTQIQLSFLGGELAGKGMFVTDMKIPLVGETGLYFVESLSQAQVNPFVGWSQGHYLIETLPDNSRVVTTVANETVIALDAPTSQAPTTSAMNSFSKGKAKGVLIQQQNQLSALSQALSVEQFKAAVRDVAEQAR